MGCTFWALPAGLTVSVAEPERLPSWVEVAVTAVSYTHLDVYKRQKPHFTGFHFDYKFVHGSDFTVAVDDD